MSKYLIKFSDETQIGGAYDEFHHEIARIMRYEDAIKVEFRSRDFNHELKSIDEKTKELDFGDGRVIKISRDDYKFQIDVNGKEIEASYPEFSYQGEHGNYHYNFIDDYNLELKTDSEEIVVPVTVGLILMAYVHNLN